MGRKRVRDDGDIEEGMGSSRCYLCGGDRRRSLRWRVCEVRQRGVRVCESVCECVRRAR